MPEQIEFPGTPVEKVFNPQDLRTIINALDEDSSVVSKVNEFDGKFYITSVSCGDELREIKTEMPLPFMIPSSSPEQEREGLRAGLKGLLSKIESHDNGS